MQVEEEMRRPKMKKSDLYMGASIIAFPFPFPFSFALPLPLPLPLLPLPSPFLSVLKHCSCLSRHITSHHSTAICYLLLLVRLFVVLLLLLFFLFLYIFPSYIDSLFFFYTLSLSSSFSFSCNLLCQGHFFRCLLLFM